MGKFIDLASHPPFGRLTVIERVGNDIRNQAVWACQCSCGNIVTVCGAKLRSGHTKSCGCLHKKTLSALRKTHGMSGTPEYNSWNSMKDRCRNKDNQDFKNYGGRGITVCDRWLNSFENFFADMGPKPSPNHSIDRKDNDGNYYPGNCKWSTILEQANNTGKLKLFYATSPIGRRYISKNQAQFARDHKLKRTSIGQVLNGKRPRHKDWTFQTCRSSVMLLET